MRKIITERHTRGRMGAVAIGSELTTIAELTYNLPRDTSAFVFEDQVAASTIKWKRS